MGTSKIIFVLCGLVLHTMGAPAPQEIPPLLTFKDGNVGVNFLGFKASAGLGGLLNGDASQGGLHASAETPFGQKAHAGLGGRVDGTGRSLGGLYAGATAGGGVRASAGLDGIAGPEGSVGRSYAGSSAGGVSKSVIKEQFGAPAGALISEEVHVQKIPKGAKEPQVPASASQIKEQRVKKTYVERTVIPNYVERTIQVPSYVEKTIRVPTIVEQTVKVPAPSTVLEQEIEEPQQPVKTKTKQIVVQETAAGVPATTVVKTRTKIHRRPWLHWRKQFNYSPAYYGGVVEAQPDPAGASAESSVYAGPGAFGNLGYRSEYYGGPKSVATTTIRKQYNGDLIRDIFNIPISTLGAVSNLVGNLAAGGSVAVSKSYGVAA